MSVRPGELIIDDTNYRKFVQATVDGEVKGMGLIPRDYAAFPIGAYAEAVPFTLPLIPEVEWEERLEEQLAKKAQLSNIRDIGANGQRIPALDQNGYPYCWAYSTTMASMIARAIGNQPYHQLSANAVACKVTDYQMVGGWCQQSLAFIAREGVPTTEFWPQQSTSRGNDNPETWANAEQHRATEWYDLDPRFMKEQLVTCLLSGLPLATDYNWWGHSVACLDLVSIKPFRTRILNSWGDNWSANGTAVLEGYQAIPNGAVSVRVLRAAIE